jgi:hypothetical protein
VNLWNCKTTFTAPVLLTSFLMATNLSLSADQLTSLDRPGPSSKHVVEEEKTEETQMLPA